MTPHPQKHWLMVSVYSISHFLVDFACAFFMFRYVAGTQTAYLCVLLYNFCAFAIQMPLGIIADRWNRNFLFAMIGCALVAIAYGFPAFPVVAVIVIGLGNALFHLGGGIDVLNISRQKLGALGVFVSPGAFGVFVGTVLGSGTTAVGTSGFPSWLFPLFMMISAGSILAMQISRKGTHPQNAAFSLEGVGSGRILIAVACLFLVVCLRSYVGLVLNFPWKGLGNWGIALVCAVVFGKTIGGVASDRFGVAKTSLASLGVAALLFLLPHDPAAGLAAVLLFNMTMPITLWAMARLFPGAKGFAFGLLTFGLFLGFLPVYFGIAISPDMFWLFPLITALSLVLLLTGLRRVSI